MYQVFGNNVNSEASLEDILTGHFVVDLNYYVMEQIAIANHNHKNSMQHILQACIKQLTKCAA